MKHVALSLLAAACGALSASALDASNARIWLDEKIQPDFAPIGGGIASEKNGSAPTYARTWQYVSIPLHVEGAAKGDTAPHFIPELKVRVSLVVSTTDAKGKAKDEPPQLLTKEVSYVDIPLVKHARKNNVGEGLVNVGVFISPANAFKLSEKDGSLAKKIVAVAVEGTFQGSACNRIKEKANEDVTTDVILNAKEGKRLSENWWKKKGGDGDATLVTIAETPFAHDYARLGFPATGTLYGAPAPAVTPMGVAATPAEAPSGSVGGPVSDTSSDAEGGSDSVDATTEDDEDSTSGSTKGKRGKKSKKSRR